MLRKSWRRLSPTQKIHIRIWSSFAGMVALMLLVVWYAYRPVIPAGVRVADWNVAGMSYTQFYAELDRALQRLERQPVILHTPAGGAPLTTTLGKLGLATNAEELRRKIQRLHEGTALQRATRRWFMKNARLDLTLMLNGESLERAVNTHWRELQEALPQNAERVIDENDAVRLIPDRPAFRIDTVRLYHELDRLTHELFYAYVNEKRNGPVTPVSVELPLKTVTAAVTVQELEAQGIREKVMEFSTVVAPGQPGRRHNIAATASVVNGTLLAPGEVFDYGRIIEQVQKRHGFREAPVILNGKLVPGLGGGICQVSTTLYNAVIRAGLDIVERRNHSLPITYAPLGQDATFSSGYINFRFRNSTDTYLLIRAQLVGQRLTVKLFGSKEIGVEYRIESRIVEIKQPSVQYVHNPGLAAGASRLIREGKPGYVVDTYRTRWENGKKTSVERLSRDHYLAQPRIVAINDPKAENGKENKASRRPIIEDGVSGPIFGGTLETMSW